jgi:hypothetical protein
LQPSYPKHQTTENRPYAEYHADRDEEEIYKPQRFPEHPKKSNLKNNIEPKENTGNT